MKARVGPDELGRAPPSLVLPEKKGAWWKSSHPHGEEKKNTRCASRRQNRALFLCRNLFMTFAWYHPPEKISATNRDL